MSAKCQKKATSLDHLIGVGKQGRCQLQFRPTVTSKTTHLLEAPGEYKVESAMQEFAILFETDR